MPTKKVARKEAKRPKLPLEVYVYNEDYNNEDFLMVTDNIDDTATKEGILVGVYTLSKVVTVRTRTEVVEE